MLQRHPEAKVTVFLVWEGVHKKDRNGVPEDAHSRVTDPRVTQLYDPDLELSKRIVKEARDRPELLRGVENVTKNMVIWDHAAVYPKGVKWLGKMPVPEFYGKPVVDVINDVEVMLGS